MPPLWLVIACAIYLAIYAVLWFWQPMEKYSAAIDLAIKRQEEQDALNGDAEWPREKQ